MMRFVCRRRGSRFVCVVDRGSAVRFMVVDGFKGSPSVVREALEKSFRLSQDRAVGVLSDVFSAGGGVPFVFVADVSKSDRRLIGLLDKEFNGIVSYSLGVFGRKKSGGRRVLSP